MMPGLVILMCFSYPWSTLAQQPAYDSITKLNTPYDEQGPVLSPDGTTLYFTVANHPRNTGGRTDPGDIWFSRQTATGWSAPIHGGAALNDKGYNAVAGLSADGHQLFLLNHFDPSGRLAKTQGLSVAHYTGNGWSAPENITIPYFFNKSVTHGYISYDLSVFVFSAESYNTRGVEDIYVSLKKDDGSWAAPKNLGGVINTRYQELSPSLSPDGLTLYYSSNGLSGNGSFDVYKATRLDDSWMNWSAPVNIGSDLNTEGRELFFRLIPQLGTALYTSTTNSDGYGDLKLFSPDEPIIDPVVVEDTTGEVLLASVAPQPTLTKSDSTIRVYGLVRSARMDEPVRARLTFVGTNGPVAVSSDEAGYSANIPFNDQYTVRIEAAGYVGIMEKLDVEKPDTENMEMNFTLRPIETGIVVNLNSVLFEQSTTNLLPGSYPELDLVVSFLQDNPSVDIELAGHTDNRGVARDNIRLSQERAEKVMEYLVSKGIDAGRITGKGYGGKKPVASNATEETRRLNRRVEFIIKKM